MNAGLWLAVLVCGASVVHLALGAWLVRRWMAEKIAPAEPLPPLTLLRPIKAGVPDLRANLTGLIAALRPGDQLVLGASVASPELACCAEVRAAFPETEVTVVACEHGAATNPKISKLLQMDAACRHERLLVTDCEMHLDRAWLDGLRAEWATTGADVLTTGYRFTGAASGPQQFDAAAILLSLWPGLAIVRRFGRVDFVLGACTALTREALAAVGGWAAFGEFLAEDRELGRALARIGRHIHLARSVASLAVDPLGWRDWWRHQRRVAVTYRIGAPLGFTGTLLTHGASAAVVVLVAAPAGLRSVLWPLAVATLAVRCLAARDLARVLAFPLPHPGLAAVVAGWMETVTFFLSWLPLPVWWSGRFWRVRRGGKLQPRGPKSAAS